MSCVNNDHFLGFPPAGVGQDGPADITDLMVEDTAQQEDDEQDEQIEIDDFDD